MIEALVKYGDDLIIGRDTETGALLIQSVEGVVIEVPRGALVYCGPLQAHIQGITLRPGSERRPWSGIGHVQRDGGGDQWLFGS